MSCSHDDIKVLGVYTESGELEVQCQGCKQKVKVTLSTLPSFHFHLPTAEYVKVITDEATRAAALALKDKDAMDGMSCDTTARS